jgi:PAS domain S-box-containing protein
MTPAADRPRALTPSRLLIRVTPEATHLLRARERLRDYLDVHCSNEEAIDQVVLAVDEACTNALRHSGTDQELEISLGFEGGDLVAEVRDHGRGFDVTSFDLGRVPGPLATDGRGLFLISRLVDELELTSDGGVVVRMVTHGMHGPDAVCGGALDHGDGARDSHYWQMRRRALTEEMGEAFAALDWEYRFTYCNGVALSLYGRALEEVCGRCIWDVFPAAEDLPVGQGVRRAMQLGISSIEEFVSPALGRWLECRIYPTSSGVSLFVRDVDERKRKELERDGLMADLCESEASARRAEERYRSLFDSMLEGFCTIEMVFDAAGQPVDYRFLEVNSAFEAQTGLHDAAGKLMRDLAPENDAYWFEIYGKVAATGEPVRFTAPATALGRIYDVSAFRVGGPGSRQVAILFDDISQRRQLEEEKDLLLEAASSLTQSMRLPDILDRLARMTLELGGHDRVVISLWQEEPARLTVACSLGEAAIADGLTVTIDDLSAPARGAIEKKETAVIDYDALEPGGRGMGDRFTSHLALWVPLLFGGRFVGLLATDDPGARREFAGRQIRLIEGIAAHAAVAIENARAYEAETAAQIEQAAQDERTRLARDLHDSITQALFAAALKAEGLLQGDDLPADSAEAAEGVRRLTRGALAQMRTLLLELRSESLEDMPIGQLLRNAVEATEGRANLRVTLTLRGDGVPPPELHTAIYRVVQEALNNVVRHSGATQASVELATEPARVRLLVHDDGRGFDSGSASPGHFGLRSMQERAAEVGAQLRLVSAPGEGTVVILDWRGIDARPV